MAINDKAQFQRRGLHSATVVPQSDGGTNAYRQDGCRVVAGSALGLVPELSKFVSQRCESSQVLRQDRRASRFEILVPASV